MLHNGGKSCSLFSCSRQQQEEEQRREEGGGSLGRFFFFVSVLVIELSKLIHCRG